MLKKATREELAVIRSQMAQGVWEEVQKTLRSEGVVWIPRDLEKALARASRDSNEIVLLLQYPVTFMRTRYVKLHDTGKLILGSKLDDRHDE